MSWAKVQSVCNRQPFAHLKTVQPLTLLTLLIALPVSVSVLGQEPAGKLKKGPREVCITFDELPMAQSFRDADREAVTYLILDALERHQVKAAGFVVGERIENGYDILGQWLNAGHTLGSLTFTNQDYNSLGIETFLSDINRGSEAMEQILSGFGQKRRYFRFPYLHYGSTVEAKKQARLYLEDRGVVVSHATVVPEDYLYNLSLEKLGKLPDSADFERLLNEYINHVLDELERVELLAEKLVNRPVRQILRLRANRLNAVYLDDLLSALSAEGYSFVGLDKALKDKVYEKAEAYYGLKGMGYLDMVYMSDPDLLPAE